MLLGHAQLVKEAIHPHSLLGVCVSTTYSASIVNSATVACFLDNQETGPPDIMKTSPDVEQQVSNSLEIIQNMLCRLLLSTQNLPPAPAPATPAPAPGPDFSAPPPSSKNGLSAESSSHF
jgi:hypothetical protein